MWYFHSYWSMERLSMLGTKQQSLPFNVLYWKTFYNIIMLTFKKNLSFDFWFLIIFILFTSPYAHTQTHTFTHWQTTLDSVGDDRILNQLCLFFSCFIFFSIQICYVDQKKWKFYQTLMKGLDEKYHTHILFWLALTGLYWVWLAAN